MFFCTLLIILVQLTSIFSSSTSFVFNSSCFSTFHLSLIRQPFKLARKPLPYSVLIDNNIPTEQWASCITKSNHNISSACFTQSIYSSYLFFFFKFSTQTTPQYPIEQIPLQYQPKILSIHHISSQHYQLNKSIPIIPYFFSSNNQRGSFSVPPVCHLLPTSSTSSNSYLQLTLSFLQLKFQYRILCPSSSIKPTLKFQFDHQYPSKSIIKTILHPPFHNIYLDSISINNSSPTKLQTNIYDHSNFNFITQLAQHQLVISYYCSSYGPQQINLTLTLHIPPFHPVDTSWLYPCGQHSPPPGLIISSKPWMADLVQNGLTNSSFHSPILLPSTNVFDLYLVYFHVEHNHSYHQNVLHYNNVQANIYSDCFSKVDIMHVPDYFSWINRNFGYLAHGNPVQWRLLIHCYRPGPAKFNIHAKFETGYLLNLWFQVHCSLSRTLLNWFSFFCKVGLVLICPLIILINIKKKLLISFSKSEKTLYMILRKFFRVREA